MVEASKFRFKFLDPGFSLNTGLALIFGAGFGGDAAFGFFVVSFQVVLRYGVPPAQLAVLPAEVEVQDVAVPPKMGSVRLVDFNGLVRAINQPVSGHRRVMIPAPNESNRQYSGMAKSA